MNQFSGVLFLWALCSLFSVSCQHGTDHDQQKSTHLATINTFLLVATLDGTLIAINRQTGHVYWTIKDDPVIQIPSDLMDRWTFLPDPKDGSVYAISSADGGIKKLPFTIPELVSASPCRSSDGFMYTGKKEDTWYIIDPLSGMKQDVLSAFGGGGGGDQMCPDIHNNPYALYIGKTVFSITMHDAKTGMKMWNVTYSCTIPQGKSSPDYDLAHFTASSSGLIATVDRTTGSLLWFHEYRSPVVAINTLGADGLYSVPFTSLASETLSHLTNHLSYGIMDKMYPRLFVGKSDQGFYALPSLVDERTINALTRPKLISGPETPLNSNPSNPSKKEIPQLPTGYYEVPDLSQAQLLKAREAIDHKPSLAAGDVVTPHNVIANTTFPNLPKNSSDPSQFLHIDVRQLAITVLLLAPMVFIVAKRRLLAIALGLMPPEKKTATTTKTMAGAAGTEVVETDEDLVVIGKISFNSKNILGKGCNGTFVFKGSFDGRDVAVKRILPDCIDLASREVELLREADSHPNVVRYFCTEIDRQFQYIALELGAATLCDYVENPATLENVDDLDSVTILKQATLGLEHLHSLNILHRDLKPQNVLISHQSGGSQNQRRIMISDFGLCKKLSTGKSSMSKFTGHAGTDGWIAPEAASETGRTTRSVDIFSLGCIFYYILSNGQHPFGDSLHRQLNIQTGRHELNAWSSSLPSSFVALLPSLIEKMISTDLTQRPSCSVILKHPMFWSEEFKMGFLQDVSDRVEKEPYESPVLSRLERGNIYVVKGDWRDHIGPELQTDLRKFRSYRGRSVRDLLRAMRNKKHHYRELPDDVRNILGSTTKDFLAYFTNIFPFLLLHVYHAMQCCKDEQLFRQYYPEGYEFEIKHASDNVPWRETKSNGASPKKKNDLGKKVVPDITDP